MARCTPAMKRLRVDLVYNARWKRTGFRAKLFASSIPRRSGERVKTDRRDAKS